MVDSKTSEMSVKVADMPEVQAAMEAAVERIKNLEELADAVLRGAESFCSSWPYTAPEALGMQWRHKVQPALGELNAFLHPEVADV